MRLPVSNADLNFECVSQQQILTKLTKCSAQIFRLSGASKVPARGYRKNLIIELKALAEALGDVQAEKFIALMMRSPFDYTKCQRKLWVETSVDEISDAAMVKRKTKSS